MASAQEYDRMERHRVPKENGIVQRRLERLWSHLAAQSTPHEGSLSTVSCANVTVKHLVRPAVLTDYMKGKHNCLQQKIFLFFRDRPELQTADEISKDEHRELTMKQLQALVKEAGIRPLKYLMENPSKYFAVFEAVSYIDLSLTIKLGVQFSLWGGSVMNLGTQKHRDKYHAGIDNLEYPGCFAMTELHHGSNVQGIQTTATFDPVTDEFVIDTPTEGATKWWIGNAAIHGQFATVFARLILPTRKSAEDPDMGVHAFIVPIRNLESHEPLPGIEIRDCGYKVGLNGIDNGALRFHSVRIPRENLLNRFGDVSRDGQYTNIFPTKSKRFAATLGELVGGRVGLACSSAGVLKCAVTIAVRYSLLRQQFGPPKQPEISVLDYQSQQRKLMPMLASAYAFHFATIYLVEKYSEMKMSQDEDELADVHALSAGLKAYVTSYTAKSLSVCREACGGHGYAAVNRFGTLRNDHDVFQTFEGDNTVLLQQVASGLLKRYEVKFEGGTSGASWKYLGESMGKYLSQTNPLIARWEGQEHLRDPKFQLDAFRACLKSHRLFTEYRTSKLLHTAAVRLREQSELLGSFEAWNRCLNHLLTLAESQIESVILERFIEAVESCKDQNTRSILKLVCDLYALDQIWNDFGNYRNVDYVAPDKAEAILRLTEYLSSEVRSVARELVDAFGLPDFVLRAPIGMQSGQYTEYARYVGF